MRGSAILARPMEGMPAAKPAYVNVGTLLPSVDGDINDGMSATLLLNCAMMSCVIKRALLLLTAMALLAYWGRCSKAAYRTLSLLRISP